MIKRLDLIVAIVLSLLIASGTLLGGGKVVNLFGNSDTKVLYWHLDTTDAGAAVHDDNGKHYDTILVSSFEAPLYTRDDGYECRPTNLPVWMYDGFKFYLYVDSLSPDCSTLVSFWFGASDTNYNFYRDSIEGGAIKKIYDFYDYYDSDSMIYLDEFGVTIVIADTITDTTASQEYNKACKVSGRLYFKD